MENNEPGISLTEEEVVALLQRMGELETLGEEAELSKIKAIDEATTAATAIFKAVVKPLLEEYEEIKAKLEVYHRKSYASTNEKTAKLPYGTLKLIEQAPKLEPNKDALMLYCIAKKLPFVVTETNIKFKWSDLKKVLIVNEDDYSVSLGGEVLDKSLIVAKEPEEKDKFFVELIKVNKA